MATEVTIETVRQNHRNAVDANRALGIVEYQSGERQVDDVHEVLDGYVSLPDGQRLGPGMRYRPLERQVKKDRRGRSFLDGKTRALSHSEYEGLRFGRRNFAGADIGLRSLDMTRRALEVAMDAKLDVADFAGIEPVDGRYTLDQVQEIIASKAN